MSNKSHIEQYQELHGQAAAKMYAFTTTQIELIKGFQLLANAELTDDEFKIVSNKLASLSSMQATMFANLLELNQQQIEHAMDSASAHIEKIISENPIQ